MDNIRYIDLKVVNEIKELYGSLPISDIETLNDIISRIIIHIKTIEGIPKFVITQSIYGDNQNSISMVRITIRPSKGYVLTSKDLKSISVFIDMNTFCEDFITFVIEWLEKYIYYAKLELNIAKLNNYIEGIVNKYDLNLQFKFTLGNLIEDIDIDSITIGLREDKVEEIDKWVDFNNDISIAEVLMECTEVYDIFKIKSEFTFNLDIFSSKSLQKLIRGCVKKDIRNVRVGIGYVETEDKFGVIEKVAVSDKDIEYYKNNKKFYIIEDNLRATKREIEKDKNKIISFYRVIPFNKRSL